MSEGNDANAETEAIGLDAASLVGKNLDEIRTNLQRFGADLALVVATEPVPDGWPKEVLKVDVEGGIASFFYRERDGIWRYFIVYAQVPDYVRGDMIPGFILTRRPKATLSALVRPIVELSITRAGICTRASADRAELFLNLHP